MALLLRCSRKSCRRRARQVTLRAAGPARREPQGGRAYRLSPDLIPSYLPLGMRPRHKIVEFSIVKIATDIPCLGRVEARQQHCC
eukprot:scaffold127252_cov57-Phaeocystis_antarctica.AAC.1